MIVSFELFGSSKEPVSWGEEFKSIDFDGLCSPIELPEKPPEPALRPEDEFALYGQFLESTFRVRDFKIEIIRGMLETLSLSPRAIVGNVDSFVDALLFLEQNGSEAEHLELVPRFGQWLNHPVVAFHFGRHYAKIFEEELKELKMNEQRELAEGFIDLFKELPKAAFYISGSVIRASRLLKR